MAALASTVSFTSLRASSGSFAKGDAPAMRVAQTTRGAPVRFEVQANKSVKKTKKVVLTKTVEGLGTAGTLVSAPNGYVRNFLLPQGMAKMATPSILEQVREEQAQEEARMEAIKKEAQQMATALSTIGKFVIKKQVGEEDKIFGSVTKEEVVDAIMQQTGRTLEKKDMDVPEIGTLGQYTCTIKLHPEVTGTFVVDVQKLAQA